MKTSLSRANVDQKCFYQLTAEKLAEAKRSFTQSLSSLSQNQTSFEQGLLLLENSIRFYERLIGEINLDTVHLYEYGKRRTDVDLDVFLLLDFQSPRSTTISINSNRPRRT